MNVCLLGHFSDSLDEGFKNIAFNLSENLKKKNNIMNIDNRSLLSILLWLRLKKFNPDIFHIISGPTLKGFVILKTLKFFFPKSKTIASALHSGFLRKEKITLIMMSLFKPDLVLTQSSESDKILKNIQCFTKTLCSGVDIDRFLPYDNESKIRLRAKYGLDKKKKIILHIGHLIKTRNLFELFELQKKNIQIVIIASSHRSWNRYVYNDLKKNNVVILEGYLKNIEEIYGLADCYIFPVRIGYSLFTPLTVLEAMSCNLPVITKRFEGLTKIFKEGNGLFFYDDYTELKSKFSKIKKINIRTREMILLYSWENIITDLEKIYAEMLSGKKYEQ